MTLLHQLRLILPRNRQVRLAVVIVLAALAAVAEAGVVVLIEPVIRSIIGSGGDGDAVRSSGSLVIFGLVLVGKNLLVAALSWVKNRELFAIQSDVSERLLAIYIRGTNPAIRKLDAGQRTSFAITEPFQLVLNCYQPLVNIVAESMAIVAVTTVLLVAHPLETLLLIGLLAAVLGGFGALTRRRIISYGHRRKDSDTGRQELVRSVIESRVEVSGLGVADEVLRRYEVVNRESAGMTARKGFLTEASKNVLEISVIVAIAPLALVFASTDGTEFVAMLATYGVAAYRALPALNRIMVSNQSLKFGVATAETISEIIAADDHDAGHPERAAGDAVSTARPRLDATLELRFRGFQLHNGKPILDGQDLCLRPGDRWVVWGPSGSGKSTLIEALVDGAEGLEIRFGGQPLPRGLSQLPGRVGVTAQSPFVMPGTLRENLGLGQHPPEVDIDVARPLLDTDPQSILDAASISERLDHPIHRHVLSGGQAQRVSLIRALDDHHDVVLLDEPTSALDHRTASALRDRIAGDTSGRIYVIVTHDAELRSVADAVVEVA